MRKIQLLSIIGLGTLTAIGAACEARDTAERGATSAAPSSASATNTSSPTTAARTPANAQTSYDLKFIDTMTEHHRGGLHMAKMAVAKSSHAELKGMAQKMVAAHERELAQLKSWRDSWFANAPAAVDHEMPGMAEAMKMDMSKLMRASGADFDHQFIDMMSIHHDGGIAMAKDALAKSTREEIKGLAAKIVDDQSKENAEMKTMSAQWFPNHAHDATGRGE